MTSMLKQCIALLLLLTMTRLSYATVYTLISDTELTGDYGFSGTITTDGSIGAFSDTSPIIDWNITLLTPGGFDGITSQVLTPSTSFMNLGFQGLGFLNITPSEISITNSGVNLLSTRLNFVPFLANESLTFQGPSDRSTSGAAVVSDVAEDPAASLFLIGDTTSATFAFVVPEPSASCLILIGVGTLGLAAVRPATIKRKQVCAVENIRLLAKRDCLLLCIVKCVTRRVLG